MRRLAISTALAVAASVALVPVGASAADTNELPPGDQQFTIDFGGGAREYLVHVPTGTEPGKRLPVVFNFYGGGSDAPTQKAYSQMDATADRHGFVVVCRRACRRRRVSRACGRGTRANAVVPPSGPTPTTSGSLSRCSTISPFARRSTSDACTRPASRTPG